MRVLCLGDSLTEGTVGTGFIPFLQESLPGNQYVNLGVNGDTIAGRAPEGRFFTQCAAPWRSVTEDKPGSPR